MYSVDNDPALNLDHETAGHDLIRAPPSFDSMASVYTAGSVSDDQGHTWSQTEKPWRRTSDDASSTSTSPLQVSDPEMVDDTSPKQQQQHEPNSFHSVVTLADMDNDQIPSPEDKCAEGEDEDDSTGTESTADMTNLSRLGSHGSSVRSSRTSSQGSSVIGKSGSARHVTFVEHDLEDGSCNGSHPCSPNANLVEDIFNNSNIPNDDLDEPEVYTQEEFEVAVEVYEDEIQQLENIIRTLKVNVAQLTNDAKMATIPEKAKKVVAVEQCQNCGGERALNSQEENIYIGLIMKEEKLQKKNKKLNKALKNEIKLTRQLSTNLKTAANTIEDVSKERDEWKAKFEELQVQVLLQGVMGMIED